MPSINDRLAGQGSMVRIYLALVVIIAGGLFAAPFAITPKYQELYKDFASPDKIPAITNLVTQVWFPILLALVPLGLVAAVLFVETTTEKRRFLVIGSVLSAMGAAALYLYGLYAPVYDLASAIK